MKRMLIGDTHLGIKNDDTLYSGIILNVFRRLCDYAKQNNIKELIHAGDFFDVRRSIGVRTIPIAFEILKMLQDTFEMSYLITGNHDLYYKNQMKPSSLQIFDNKKNISVISESTIIDNIHLEPWVIDEFVPQPVDYLIGHFEMSGIIINRVGTKSVGGLSPTLFKKYKKVMSGHYHTRSEMYLGSPFHMSFNDDGERGFYTFDDDNGELEFIPFTEAPKFLIFEHDKIDFNIVAGNNVKIVFTKDIGTTKINNITNKVLEQNPIQFFVEFNFDETFTDENICDSVESIIDIRTIEKKYIDKAELPDHIDRKMLDSHLNILWEKLRG